MKNQSILKYKASMTVELTLLMPLIIGVFLLVFFTMYYLHDVVAVNKGICTALLRGGLEKEEDLIMPVMNSAAEDVRLLGKWQKDIKYGYDMENVNIEYSGTMEAVEGLFRKITSKEYVYVTKGSNHRIDEVNYIRKNKK